MLRAVERHTPIIPLRIATVSLPLYIQEKQPVEVRDSDPATLSVLTQRINAQRPNNRAATTDDMPPTVNTLQRQREIAYLEGLIHNNYSDREGLYVPLVRSRAPFNLPGTGDENGAHGHRCRTARLRYG